MPTNRSLLSLLFIFFLLTLAAPVTAEDQGPPEVKLPAKLGTVTFPHRVHQERIGNCQTCHHKGVEAGACRGCHDIVKRAPQGKDAFHKVCRGCHEDQGGPTQCNGCHVRQ